MTAIGWIRRHAARATDRLQPGRRSGFRAKTFAAQSWLDRSKRLKRRATARETGPLWFQSQRLIGSAAMLLVVSFVGIAILALLLLPFQYQQARRRWEQRHIRHYEVEVAWASGWSFGHVRVEMRDNQLVKAVDLDTGRPLDSSKLLSARYFGSIDQLFEIIEVRMRPEWAWRNLLERYSPSLARRIDSCVAPLSDVGYDPQFGFPNRISYNDGWCTITFFDYSNVRVVGFQPLP
jgi:hypothetical protein